MSLRIDEKELQQLRFDEILDEESEAVHERQSSRFSIVQNAADFSTRNSRISFAFQQLEQHLYGTVHISVADSLKQQINKLKEESDLTTKQLEQARIKISELRAQNDLLREQSQSQKEIIQAQQSFVEVLEKKGSSEIVCLRITSDINETEIEEKYRKIYDQRMQKERESYEIRIQELRTDFQTFFEEKKIIQTNIFELSNLNERKSAEIHNLNIILHNKITKINEIKKVVNQYYEIEVKDEDLVEKIQELIANIQLVTEERAKDLVALAQIENILEKRKRKMIE